MISDMFSRYDPEPVDDRSTFVRSLACRLLSTEELFGLQL